MKHAGIVFRLFYYSNGLPERARHVFEAQPNFSLSYDWFCNIAELGLAPGSEALFGVLTEADSVLAVIPLQSSRGRDYRSLTNCYTCLYHPLVSLPSSEVARLLGKKIAAHFWDQPVFQLDCVPSEWPLLQDFEAGISAAGLVVRQFHQFGNWYAPIKGKSWDEYLGSRPGNLRELLRRRQRQLSQKRLSFEILEREEEVSRGILAYEAIYARSWKPAEPFPRFNPELMRRAARLGVLRLGLCWQEDKPIAAQLWITALGSATIMKLAHDESARELSPGTLLLAVMIERLIYEGAAEIDFGRGDDAYKRLWAGHCRERIGLMILNPRRLRGLATLAAHDLGRATRGLRKNLQLKRQPSAR